MSATPRRRWLVTVAAIVGMSVTAFLGNWQLSRAAYKRGLQQDIAARQSMPPLDNATLSALPQVHDGQHQPVRLRGRWLDRYTVYLDNRPLHGRPGFHVLTPLVLDVPPHGAPLRHGVIVVQRGWVARDLRDPAVVPRIDTPGGPVEISGRLARPPSRMLELDGARSDTAVVQGEGAAPRASGSSPIRQNLDLQGFAAEVGVALAVDGIVLQTGAPSEGLLRAWPEPGAGVEKHYGYAFQWFGLSALIAVLYVWFQFIAPRRRARPR